MEFNPDSPITGESEAEDILGRTEFCSRLIDRIRLPRGSPGLVVSLEGPWGSGKTSTINLTAAQLNKLPEIDRPVVVHFNPWMVGSLSALVEEFFVQIASAIGLSSIAERAGKLSEALISYSRLFSFVKWIPGAEPYASIGEKLLEKAGGFAKSAGELSRLNIADQKKRVSDAIVELGKPFVVFIDDIDRLPPDEVFAMIRLVKAVSDFRQVAYVLAFDPSYVETALENFGIRPGRTYLDKIVQVRLSLPRIGLAQIGKLVDREADSLGIEPSLSIFPKEKDRVASLYHNSIKFLLRTPRDVYRVFNRLRVSEPATRNEVGFADVFAIETIAIVAPSLYDHIRMQPQAYVGPLEEMMRIIKKPDDMVKESKDDRESALDRCDPTLQSFLRVLLAQLFPLTSDGQVIDKTPPPRTSGRIACSENLLIALSGGLPPSEISLAKVRAFIEEPKRMSEIAEEFANDNQLEDFLDLVNNALKSGPPPAPENLFVVLAMISELDVVKEINHRHGADILKVHVGMQIFWILKKVLQAMDSEQAKTLIKKLVSSSKKLSLSTNLLEYLCDQQGLFNERGREPENSWLVSSEELESLVASWVESTRQAFLSGDAWNSNEAGRAFYLLKRLDPEGVKDIVSRSLKSKEVQDRLFRTIGRGGCDSTKGHYAEISESFLNEIGDAAAIRRIAAERLSDPQLDTQDDLRAIYTSISSGEKQYFCDFVQTS